MESSAYIKIPKDRIGVLIGSNGYVKERVEERLSIRLQIESETGTVTITNTQDPSSILRAKEVVNAIGRGFSPERAFLLLEDDATVFQVIDLREMIGDSYSDLNRIKGRIIGKNGKTRSKIEEATNTKVSIYGHTVSLIGDIDQVEVAREAIFMLIKGRQHQTVYRFLHRKRSMLKRKEMEIWETKP